MKFAFTSSMTSVPWGGSEVLWYEAAEYLAKAGNKVALCTPYWPKTPHPLHTARTSWGHQHTFSTIPHSSSFSRRFQTRLLRRPANSFQRGWLRKTKPQLLCISNGNAYQGLAWMQAALAEDVPFATISQAHADFLAPDDITARALIEGFSAAKANYFVSHANQHMVECQLGWRFPNARLIGNHSRHLPINGPLPWPTTGKPANVFRLALVARLHPPSKGHDLLIEVLAHPRWRDRSLEVSFYGSGEHEESLRRLVSLFNLSDRIRFMGHTNNPMDIWQSHHALILPSRYEGLPLVLMEAMLAGRPVITTAVAGAPELVTHGVDGFVAESPSVHHLQDCLESAWMRRQEWKAMGMTAFANAAQRAQIPPALHLARDLISFLS